MSDLNVMLREHARTGLQTQLDAAVTNGDAEAARKIAADIEKLAVQTAPKAPPFTSADVWKVAETKAAWLGVDPKKSAVANEFAKTMNPAKFASAEAMADAIIKAVEDEIKPAAAAKTPPENETDEEREAREAAEQEAAEAATAARAKKKTDGPSEGDTLAGRAATPKRGPWTKLSDAPKAVQDEVTRTANKFAPKTKEGREGFITKALESHYNAHLRSKGK